MITELKSTVDVVTTTYSLKGLTAEERLLLDRAEAAFDFLSQGAPPESHSLLLKTIKEADLVQAKFELFKEQGRHVIVCVNRYN